MAGPITIKLKEDVSYEDLIRRVQSGWDSAAYGEPRMQDIHRSVIPALRLRGSRKAVIPLEMASTPVRAEVPLEKARRIRNSESACAACTISIGGGFSTLPNVPVR